VEPHPCARVALDPAGPVTVQDRVPPLSIPVMEKVGWRPWAGDDAALTAGVRGGVVSSRYVATPAGLTLPAASVAVTETV
jgi:hypothetical protein